MKALRIIQLVLFTIAIISLVAILVLFIRGNFNLSGFAIQEKQVLLSEVNIPGDSINMVKTNLSSANIYVIPSESEQIKVRYLGPESEKENPKVRIEENTDQITITQDLTISLFQIVTTERRIEIYLPESYQDSIDLSCSSGDLKIEGDYSFDTMTINLSSGEISAENLTTKNTQVRLISGDLKIKSLKSDSYSVKSNSGELVFQELEGKGKLDCTSGNIHVDKMVSEFDVYTGSGEIFLGEMSGQGKINCISGDVHVEIAKSLGDLDISTTSGEVTVKLSEKSGYFFTGDCVAGYIRSDFPLKYDHDNHASGEVGAENDYKLSVKTTAGDIDLQS